MSHDILHRTAARCDVLVHGGVRSNPNQANQAMVKLSASNTNQTHAILGAIEQIYKLSSENTRSVEEISQASKHLTERAENLGATIDRFKI